MSSGRMHIWRQVSVAVGLVLFATCESPTSVDKIWPLEEDELLPDPVITSVEPSDTTFAGVGDIVITGSNFATLPAGNFVSFGGIDVSTGEATALTARITAATATSLTIESPSTVMDSVTIKVSSKNATFFAEYGPYTLTNVAPERGNFGLTEFIYAMDVDSSENLYVSRSDQKIVKFDPAGDMTIYTTISFPKFTGMKFGPDGGLYGVNILAFIFKVPPGGGADALWAVLPGRVNDLDFDENGNLFAGGGDGKLIAALPDASSSVKATYTDINIGSVRVYDGYVYFSGTYKGTDSTAIDVGIWRNQILNAAGDLGPNLLVADWADYPGAGLSKITSITFDNNGTLFIGNTSANTVVTLTQAGEWGVLYPRVLEPETVSMTWGYGPYLYINRGSVATGGKNAFKVDTGLQGAPYYGRP